MRIGELADRTGTTTKTIRYYESLGLLPTPARTAAGYRTYPDDSVWRLQLIRDLRVGGFDLATIGSLLHVVEGSTKDGVAKDLVGDAVRLVDDRLAQFRRMRAELDDLAHATP